MIIAKRKKGESLGQLLKRFRLMIEESGWIEEIKSRQFFQGNGDKKKLRLREKWVKVQQYKQKNR